MVLADTQFAMDCAHKPGYCRAYMFIHLHSPGDSWKSTKSPGKENQSPVFSVKPKQIFFYVIFQTRHDLIGFHDLIGTRVCFF